MDVHTTLPPRHPVTTAAIIGALGIVFGDIGTSPLYAFKESFRVAMEGGVAVPDAVMGVLSMIFWALTITISIKYLMFVLRADNDGEGGVFALITGLKLDKATTTRAGLVLLTFGLLGAAMLFGDGVITPAISVLSAVEGLQVVAPALEHWVVHITIAVIIGVFMSQRFGTEKIGMLYGPICLVWFVTLGLLGLRAIIVEPSVLMAIHPGYAFSLLTTHPGIAAAMIGAVFLCVTGAEALFADMGHFGRGVIRRAWFYVVLPCLFLNYFGQGALTIKAGSLIENPFYELAPAWFGVPLLVLATLATIVASQAMITGAFAIARQAIEIGYFPPMRVKSTSDTNNLHIFIPRLNVALMSVTLMVIVLFPSSEQLASAYGIAVATAMLMTTILFTVWMLRKSGWPRVLAMLLCLVFLTLDSSYVITNLLKVFDGGWLPIAMGGFVLTCMIAWNRGIEKIIKRHIEHTELLEDFAARVNQAPLSVVNHTGVFFSRSGILAPVPLEHLSKMLHVKFERTVVVSIRILPQPYVDPEHRLIVSSVDKTMLKIEISYGYQQTFNIPSTIGSVLADNGIDANEVIYIIGHERVIAPAELDNVFDLMQVLFAFLAATAERSVDRFRLPPSRTLEVGYPVYLKR